MHLVCALLNFKHNNRSRDRSGCAIAIVIAASIVRFGALRSRQVQLKVRLGMVFLPNLAGLKLQDLPKSLQRVICGLRVGARGLETP